MAAKYNFDKNLLKLSRAKSIEEAKEEWYVIDETTLATQSAICICSRKIKEVTYLYNHFTEKTIIAGSRCCKKFNMLSRSLGKNMYTTILREFLKKGEYVIIDDIIEYSANVEAILIKRCEYRFESYKNSSHIFNLDKLKDEIIEMETIYGITYLNHLLVLIDASIKEIHKKNEEEVKRIKELREAIERAEEQAREEAQKAAEAQEILRAEARERAKQEADAQERVIAEAREAAQRVLDAELEKKRRLKLEHDEAKRVADEKKRKEKEERIALLPTLTCINCFKVFKDSPCRSTSCCSLRCELTKYP